MDKIQDALQNVATEGQVTVCFVPSQTVPHSMCVRVQVRCVLRPKSIMTSDIELDKITSQTQLERLIAATAGACAENNATRHGDPIDPDRCAHDAVKAWMDLLKQPATKGYTLHDAFRA